MSYRMPDYLVPDVNFSGPDAISIVGERCQLLGGKEAPLVTDRSPRTIKDDAVDKALHYPWEARTEVTIFSDVEPNSKDTNMYDDLAVSRREQCDIIVATGGGSLYDCGRGVGITVIHGGDLYQHAGTETLTNPLPSIAAVNTTVGTASKVTRHCVLASIQTKAKFMIVNWHNLPPVSINDPLLMIGKPTALTAATEIDAPTHAAEAYTSEDTNPVTDIAVMQAIRLIIRNLRQAVALGSDLQARESMACASLLAGMALNNANLGYVHATTYQLGGLYDMPRGVASAVLLPYVARYNLIANPEKFADIAELMGEDITGLSTLNTAKKVIAAVMCLSMDIGIPQHLRDLGVKKADFPYMAGIALKGGNAFSNPRKGNEQEIVTIFRQAF